MGVYAAEDTVCLLCANTRRQCEYQSEGALFRGGETCLGATNDVARRVVTAVDEFREGADVRERRGASERRPVIYLSLYAGWLPLAWKGEGARREGNKVGSKVPVTEAQVIHEDQSLSKRAAQHANSKNRNV